MLMQAMERLASGREADVLVYGEGLVLRRYRIPANAAREAEAMEHARAHGFPVPAVHAVLSPKELVMERVEGPTMLADLTRHPWMVRRHARTLAELHERLHAVRAPASLWAPLGDGKALLHLDLHPDNVILTRRGPMVIDWSLAARGTAATDVAVAWLIIAVSAVPGGLAQRRVAAALRRLFLREFLSRFDDAELMRLLPAVAEWRLERAILGGREREAIRALVQRVGAAGNPGHRLRH
jgi:tRNA A-37 threonylcarbamoyl transferase component Bud32